MQIIPTQPVRTRGKRQGWPVFSVDLQYLIAGTLKVFSLELFNFLVLPGQADLFFNDQVFCRFKSEPY